MKRLLKQPRVRIALGDISISGASCSSADSGSEDGSSGTDESTDSEVEDSTSSGYKEWAVAGSYKQWEIITHNGVDYIVMQDITDALESQSPDADDMLALYMIWRGEGLYEWLYGEYVKLGWQRTYEGDTYECITETAGANIYEPIAVESVWSKVKNVEA